MLLSPLNVLHCDYQYLVDRHWLNNILKHSSMTTSQWVPIVSIIHVSLFISCFNASFSEKFINCQTHTLKVKSKFIEIVKHHKWMWEWNLIIFKFYDIIFHLLSKHPQSYIPVRGHLFRKVKGNRYIKIMFVSREIDSQVKMPLKNRPLFEGLSVTGIGCVKWSRTRAANATI